MAKRKKKAARSEQAAWKAFEEAYAFHEAGDFAKARTAYEHAAQLGSPHAQINLANLYDGGEFGRRNRTRAIQLYKLAFEQGFSQAACGLAHLYRQDNVPRWYIYWLREAAGLGDEYSEADLRTIQNALKRVHRSTK